MEKQKLIQNLINTISNIIGNGSFYSYGKSDFIIPRLKVGTELEVSFPIQPDTAKKLISYAVQAPYGKGSDTLVDTKVRKTWEIDGKNVTFGNPAWKKLIAEIMNKVRDDFSLQDVVVEPHLYKLLIYEKGGFFLKHKDTEKQEGMFASLVINLPSEFTGGELEIEWNGESKKIDFSKHSYDIPFAAFYADCDHEVHPVKSGYRISIVYNLIKMDNGQQLGLSTLPKAVDEISEILTNLATTKIEKPFLYLLEHQYTPTNFAVNNLKDNDINRSDVIINAAKKAGYYADLGLLSHHIDGELDYNDYGNYKFMHDIDPNTVTMSEIIDEYIVIGDWLETLYPAIRNLNLDEVEILNNRNYKDLEEAISANAEGYMGNYGPSVEYDYHLGAVLLFPFQSIGNFISNATPPILLGWIDYFLKNRIDNFDYNDLINTFLSIDSRDNHWNKGELDVLVDCIDHNIEQNIRYGLIVFIGKHLFALESKKAVVLIELLKKEEVRILLVNALDNDNHSNLLVVLELFLNLEIKATTSVPNILNAYSEFIFNSVPLLFKAPNRFSLKDNDMIEVKILTTLLKISDHLSINSLLEPKFSRNVDRKFIHKFLAPIVMKNQTKRNDLWQLFYKLIIDNLKLYTEVKPTKPVDWKRDFNFDDKLDTQLEILKSFLQDAEKATFVYAKSQSYRSKMEYLIKDLKLDISCTTIKRGSPHELHLTKNENSFREKLKAFEKDTKMLEIFEAIR